MAAARSTALPRALIPAMVGLVAFVARLLPVVQGGGLTGRLFYDDGVYYTAAASFTAGRWPYRDFLLVHPPGIALVVAPFTVLGRLTSDPTGLVAARLAFMALGAATAILVMVIVGRTSTAAGIVGGLFYALWTPAAHSETSTLLEPLVNLALAAALVVLAEPRTVTRRRVIVAGAVIGGACAVKLWAVVPFVVLAVWIARSAGRRTARDFVVGSGAAFAVICVPFLVMAPTAMPRMVLLDQISRSSNGVGPVQRLADILSLSLSNTATVGAAAAAAALVMAVLIAIAAAGIAKALPQARVWVALLASNTITLLLVSAYFPKYADFVALPLALVVGGGAHLVLAWAAQGARIRLVGALALTAVALITLGTVRGVQTDGRRAPDAWLASAARGERCIATDKPIILVEADALSSDLRHGCEVAADPTGTSYDLTGARVGSRAGGTSRVSDLPWQQWITDYLLDPNAFVIDRTDRAGVSLRTSRCLTSEHLVGSRNGLSVFSMPTGSPTESRALEATERSASIHGAALWTCAR